MSTLKSRRRLGCRAYLSFAALATAVILGLRCAGPTSSGGGGGTNPPTNQSGSEPEVMKVTRFDVAAGQTQRVSANLEIIAAEGINIAGDLIVDGSVEGDLTLTAEDGDVVISGRIIVEDGDAAAKSMADGAKDGVSPSAQFVVSVIGASIYVSVGDSNRRIVLGDLRLISAGDGENAPEESFSGARSTHVGAAGGKGGDISLYAPNGTIVFPASGRVIGLGDGGKGASVTVDASTFNTDEADIAITGGAGGASGELRIDAAFVEGAVVEGVITVESPEGTATSQEETVFAATPRGGDGGNVIWDNSESETVYPNLAAIKLTGGAGGRSARRGGWGGSAFYWSHRVINEVGRLVASVTVQGGRGGDVFGTPLLSDPLNSTSKGGMGGYSGVHGNNGWNGGEAADGSLHRDGAHGGDVTAIGGDGGDVLDSVRFAGTTGGDVFGVEGESFRIVYHNGSVSTQGGEKHATDRGQSFFIDGLIFVGDKGCL